VRRISYGRNLDFSRPALDAITLEIVPFLMHRFQRQNGGKQVEGGQVRRVVSVGDDIHVGFGKENPW
jgi:hypothetical protein